MNKLSESIYLDNLIKAHIKSTNRRHRLILQDLFYLCKNDSFVKNIVKTRKAIIKKLKTKNIKLQDIPTDQKVLAKNYKDNLFKKGFWNWYREQLGLIAYEHNYYEQCFIDKEDLEDFNILENIIFLNDPVWSENSSFGIPLRPRAGNLSIDYDVNGAYIRAKFDIGTDKRTMKIIIDKDFGTVAKLREKEYRIPINRREIDSDLLIKNEILKMSANGDTDTEIAVKLESKGLKDVSLDKVRLKIERAKVKIARFDIERQ